MDKYFQYSILFMLKSFILLLFIMMTKSRCIYCDKKFEHLENTDPFRCPECEKNNNRKFVNNKW